MPKNKVKDPTQQALRQHKRQWNALYRDFAVKMKAFKNSINGKGDAKFSLPPSDIKDPLPTEVASFLSQLAGEFQQLVGGAETIVSEQSGYSRTRKKKQQKPSGFAPTPSSMPVVPTNTATTLEQAVGYYYDNSIQKIGSNKLTRFWEYVSSVFSTDANKKHRAGLLSSSAELFYEFRNFENSILSLNVDSIPQSINHFQNIKFSFEALKKSFEKLMETVKEKIEDGEIPIPPEPESIKQDVPDEYTDPVSPLDPGESKGDREVKKIAKDLHLIYDIGLGGNVLLDINQLVSEYRKESDSEGKALIRDRIVDEYKILIKSIISSVQKKYGPAQINNLQDVLNLIKRNQPKTASNLEITKIAHNFATRFLKKQLLKARPYNKTAVHRLEVDKFIDLAMKTLNSMMDSLQGGNDMFSSVNDYMIKLEEIITNIGKPLSILSIYYKEDFYNRHKTRKAPKDKIQEEDSFQESAMRNKIKRDIQRDLF